MTDAMSRRGPDAQGLASWGGAVLGHRRLAIFDLSDAGRQPMASADGSVAVVFNGAIYNFIELRKQLEDTFEFRTRTDTEVLLHGYRKWGSDELVRRLRGMFAFAIWDDQQRELTLVRDRLGVKPLVYTSLPSGHFAFATTPRALKAVLPDAALNESALLEFLEFGFVPEAESIYKGMQKLPPGSILTRNPRGVTQRRYWRSPDANTRADLDFREASAQVEHLLVESTRLRLFADVPVGALLSGGVDSSLVCWAAAQTGADVTAFTVGVPGDQTDETAVATDTARRLGIRHEVLPLIPDEAPDPLDIARAFPEPFACSSALAMLGVSRLVKSRATCLLTGDGGDDLFLGYPEHLALYRAQKIARAMPCDLLEAWRRIRAAVPPWSVARRIRHFVDYSLGGLPAVLAAHDGLPFFTTHDLLGPALRGRVLERRQRQWNRRSAVRVLQDFLAYDQETRFTGEYLTKVDGATMHYALEARSPFLDHVLWEYGATLPFDLRLRGGKLKAVLRDIAARRVGVQVATAKKQGFIVPVQRWLANEWRPTLLDAFAESELHRAGLVNRDPLLRLVADRDMPQIPLQVWRLFILEHWLRLERPSLAQWTV